MSLPRLEKKGVQAVLWAWATIALFVGLSFLLSLKIVAIGTACFVVLALVTVIAYSEATDETAFNRKPDG